MTRNVKAITIPTEDQEQIRFATWLANKGIRFYAIPNGGQRNLLEAIKMKRMGVSPGVPDLCIPLPLGSYHGLYIELKRASGGRLSAVQNHWLEYLRKVGYYADVANGCDEAIKIVEFYLSLSKISA